MLKPILVASVLLTLPTVAQARHHPYHRAYHSLYRSYDNPTIVPHPSGCPSHAFCGCGVAVHIFGRPIRNLYLAANWLRFPRATPGPGMVAARHHHVMAILSIVSPGLATVYDPNSGGHATRIHTRSLAGYAIVNPHGGQA